MVHVLSSPYSFPCVCLVHLLPSERGGSWTAIVPDELGHAMRRPEQGRRRGDGVICLQSAFLIVAPLWPEQRGLEREIMWLGTHRERLSTVSCQLIAQDRTLQVLQRREAATYDVLQFAQGHQRWIEANIWMYLHHTSSNKCTQIYRWIITGTHTHTMTNAQAAVHKCIDIHRHTHTQSAGKKQETSVGTHSMNSLTFFPVMRPLVRSCSPIILLRWTVEPAVCQAILLEPQSTTWQQLSFIYPEVGL